MSKAPEDAKSVRRTFELSREANENFKEICKQTGVNQFLFVSALLEQMTSEDPLIQSAIEQAIKARPPTVSSLQGKLRNLSPEALAKLDALIEQMGDQESDA